jgi:hypothetical protein
VDFSDLRQIGGSSLTDAGIPVREGEPLLGVIPSSYVPFRNAHLLSAAASWGEVLGARAIFVGAVWEDSSGYPDCRPEFYRAFEEAIRLGTKPETRLRIGDAAHLAVEGRDRPPRRHARGAFREDLVLLPGRSPRLWRLRIVPAAAARLSRGR